MDDVFAGRMAGPHARRTAQKTALQAWVDTIPALPATPGLDAAAVARGRPLFNDAQVACASCHAGTLLTNNTTVDVGTGQALQVPSLRGVSWRAPVHAQRLRGDARRPLRRRRVRRRRQARRDVDALDGRRWAT